MDPKNPHDDLDASVPQQYRFAVPFAKGKASAANQPEANGASAVQVSPNTEVPEMDPKQPNTGPAVVDIESIKDVARAEASRVLADANKEQAIAKLVLDLKTNEATAKAEASTAKADLAVANTSLTAANDSVTKLTGDLDVAVKATAAEVSTKAAVQKLLDDAKLELATAHKAIADTKAVATISDRTKALETAGLKTDARLAKAVARKEDGSFAVSDEEFTSYVADLSEVATTAKATASTAAPAAGEGSTAPAPAATEVKPEGEVVEGTEAPVQATASVTTPAAPDVSSAELQARALASAFAGRTEPSAEGVSKMAELFKD